MRKRVLTRISRAAAALTIGLVVAVAPSLADACSCWRHHHHHISAWRWSHARWAHSYKDHFAAGWGPGYGFAALTGVDPPAQQPFYNRPYYYGGGYYGSCGGHRLLHDQWGNVLGWQSVYIC